MDIGDCFGSINTFSKLEECSNCPYFESCKFYIDNPEHSVDQRSGLVSYDRYAFSEEVSQNSKVIDNIDSDNSNIDNKLLYTNDDLQNVVNFMLTIDDYTLEILSEMLESHANTSADLARNMGVTRQAIHRKLIDACHNTPKLRTIFAPHLYRCKRILKDKENRKNKNNPNSEFIQLGLFDEEDR